MFSRVRSVDWPEKVLFIYLAWDHKMWKTCKGLKPFWLHCIFQLIWDRQRLSKQTQLHSARLKSCQHSSTVFLDFWRCINIAGCIKAEWITFPVKAVGVMGYRRWVWRRHTSQRDSHSGRQSLNWEEAARFLFSAFGFVYLTFCHFRSFSFSSLPSCSVLLLHLVFCSELSNLDQLDPKRHILQYWWQLNLLRFWSSRC